MFHGSEDVILNFCLVHIVCRIIMIIVKAHNYINEKIH